MNVTEGSEKRSVTWGMFMFSTRIISIHEEEKLRQRAFHQGYERSHNETNVRHIFEIVVRYK